VRCVDRLVHEGRVASAGACACPGDSRATQERVRWRRMGRVLPVGVMLRRGGEVRSSAAFVPKSAVERTRVRILRGDDEVRQSGCRCGGRASRACAWVMRG
jgi:hypothetical protein